jgi:hypothetical protein
METINGCTVGPASKDPEPVHFGAAETEVPTSLWSERSRRVSRRLRCMSTDETFYVADGGATFQLGDREVPLTGGGLVFVPRGMPHTVWNSGDRPVRGLILVSPGGAEHVFVPVEAG